MATLNTWNYFSLVAQGTEATGKQGTSTDDPLTPFPITVTGTRHTAVGSIADDAIATIWDEDDDNPTDFDFLHFWADQDCFLQIIGTATNTIFPVKAKVPFTLSGNTILAAADTTVMTAGVEPTLTAIDSIVVSNMSGSTLNYVASIID